ncbi:hypothetical protein HETIRDRAFT_165480 [Heterobasidion irregulare TC 32-1]|uniref:Uncharacterized protein n=1 Tax=Heterobasidion irregulare (strain TC 32-1) TaxID=747525 RepID=W4JZ03_HETIT|nr:uncharacterized protein HETIRDRAFT_165480 [Heterobasidion irregulare TC 32-1]ETW78295.1 hypothetical protein HETIRDRAFT_165480 [Heterobasidion irregulare TC 32-1]
MVRLSTVYRYVLVEVPASATKPCPISAPCAYTRALLGAQVFILGKLQGETRIVREQLQRNGTARFVSRHEHNAHLTPNRSRPPAHHPPPRRRRPRAGSTTPSSAAPPRPYPTPYPRPQTPYTSPPPSAPTPSRA